MNAIANKLLWVATKPMDCILIGSSEFINLIVTFAIHWLIRRAGLEVFGRENLPTDRMFIIVSSHCLPMAAEYDIIKFFVRQRMKPWTITSQPVLSKFAFLQRFITFLWRRYHPGAILIDGSFKNSDLANNAIKELQNGVINWVSPEGTRNYGVGLLHGQIGIAKFMVASNQYPVVPMAVVNDDNIKFTTDLFKPHPELRLNIGKPFLLKQAPISNSRRELVNITDEVMRRIALLMPANKRGYYANSVQVPFKYTIEL